jgi:hypothetical protein
LIEQIITNVPLSECDTAWALPSDNDNLNRLSKAVDKFKGKLKTRMSSSALKKRKSELSIPTKQIQFEQALTDHSKYAATHDYPYNDSDGYIDKIEML